MLPRQLIEQLEAFDSAKDRVLSTFSTSHPIGAPAIPYRVALEDLIKE
jgi:hypothetical protein